MDYQNDFTIEEFAERRQRLAANLDAGTVALIPGAGAMQGSQVFRQFNDFYYLCGVEVPHAYLQITADARATIFLAENQHTPFTADNADYGYNGAGRRSSIEGPVAWTADPEGGLSTVA